MKIKRKGLFAGGGGSGVSVSGSPVDADTTTTEVVQVGADAEATAEDDSPAVDDTASEGDDDPAPEDSSPADTEDSAEDSTTAEDTQAEDSSTAEGDTTAEDDTASAEAKKPDTKNDTKPETFPRSYVEQLRSEAANFRAEKNKLAKQVKELSEQLAAAEGQAVENRRIAARLKVATTAQVPAELLPDTDDEQVLESAAKALVEWAEGKAAKGAPKVDRVGDVTTRSSRESLARMILGT